MTYFDELVMDNILSYCGLNPAGDPSYGGCLFGNGATLLSRSEL